MTRDYEKELGYVSVLENWLSRLKDLDKEAYEKLMDFFSEPENLNYSVLTKINYAQYLVHFLEFVKKPLREVSEADFKRYLAWLKEQGRAMWTLRKRYYHLRKFLRYCGIQINFRLRFREKNLFPTDPSNFLTDEELEKLLKYLNIRDRAIVMLLRETGMRLGECLMLNVGDIEPREKFWRIHIRYSKTAERYVEIIKAIPYLKAWLEAHPLLQEKNKDPKEIPLFVSFKKPHKRLLPQNFRERLKKALKEAGINKKIYPHLFRHQVATELLTIEGLPEEAVRVYMGWTHGSRMIARYSHVSCEQANRLILKTRYGFKELEKEQVVMKPPKECPRCGKMVSGDAKYCPYCGFCLTREAIIEVKEQKETLNQLLEALLKKPELMRKLVDKLKEIL